MAEIDQQTLANLSENFRNLSNDLGRLGGNMRTLNDQMNLRVTREARRDRLVEEQRTNIQRNISALNMSNANLLRFARSTGMSSQNIKKLNSATAVGGIALGKLKTTVNTLSRSIGGIITARYAHCVPRVKPGP